MDNKDVFEKNLKFFDGDELAAKVTMEKYLLTDQDGNFLESDYSDIAARVAKEIIRVEDSFPPSPNKLIEEDLKNLIEERVIVPHGSPLHGIGNNESLTTISNCFVLPSPKDSISGIMEAAKDMSNLYKARGGVGIDISSLRPEKARVKNSAKTSTGAWSFANLYSNVTGSIGQCIAEDSQVLTKAGLKNIQDISAGEEVLTKEGWVKVVALHKNGEKPVKKIVSDLGLSLRATDEHIFSFFETEDKKRIVGNIVPKKLKDIKVDESIIMLPGVSDWGHNDNFDLINRDFTVMKALNFNRAAAEAYYTGMFCAASARKSIRINENNEYEIYFPEKKANEVRPFRRFLFKVFGARNCALKKGKKTVFKVSEPNFIAWLKDLGAIRERDEDGPNFPKDFFKLDKEAMKAFIAGYYQAQGFQGPSPITDHGFVSRHKNHLEKIQIALFAMGVCSSLTYKFFTEDYELTIVGAKSLENFYEMYRKGRWVPNEWRDKIKKRKMDPISTPYHITLKSKIKNAVSWRFFYKLFEKPHENVIIKRRVRSIEDDGVAQTYDLELEREHYFWCNGFYVHNSGRRGALMLAMDCRHPDIEKFISCKLDLTKVTNANISVKFTDDFMRAVENDEKYILRWPVNEQNPTFTKIVSARSVWEKFVKANIKSAEPGALFWDRMSNFTPNSSYKEFKPVCVNPCAEVAMAPYSNCRLLSLNLSKFVKNCFEEGAEFDYEAFSVVVKKAIRVLDAIVEIDVEKMRMIQESTDEQDVKTLWGNFIDKTLRGREIGLGTLALADTLACLRIKYGTDESFEVVDRIYSVLVKTAYETSAELANERGPFLEFDPNVTPDEFLIFNGLEDCLFRRHISLLTCAPTGSISILAQSSSGIEPVYRNEYTRRRKVSEGEGTFVALDGQRFEEHKVYHHNVMRFKKKFGEDAALPDYFVESHEIEPHRGVNMQGIIQQRIDHSISRTLNLPAGISFEKVDDLYMNAWRSGLKGVTIYVDGSREGVLVSESKQVKTNQERPERLKCEIHHATIKGQKWIVFVGLLDGSPYEVFCGLEEYIEISPKIKDGIIVKKKTHKGERSIYELIVMEGTTKEFRVSDIVETFKNDEHMVLGRMISLALRASGKPAYVSEQLFKDTSSDFMSYNKVLARILKKYIKDGEKPEAGKCSECGGELTYQEGCPRCSSCGFTKCS